MKLAVSRGLKAIAYFFLFVAFFGVIYAYAIPGQFLYNDAARSQDYLELEENVIRQLEAGFVEDIVESRYGTNFKSFVENHVREGTTPTAEIFLFDTRAYADANSRTGKTIAIFNLAIEFVPDEQSPFMSGRFNERIYSNDCALELDVQTRPELQRAIGICRFQGVQPDGGISNGNMVLRSVFTSASPYPHLEAFKDLAFADTRNIEEGRLWRMMYFSSVTASTLGYGDIVPIGPLARLFVAIESIFGLILMGSLVWWVTEALRKEGNKAEDHSQYKGH